MVGFSADHERLGNAGGSLDVGLVGVVGYFVNWTGCIVHGFSLDIKRRTRLD